MNLNQLSYTLIESERSDIWLQKGIGFRTTTSPGGLQASQNFTQLYSIIGNERRTEATLSSVFWQIFTSSNFFRNYFLKRIDISHPKSAGGRLILTMNTDLYGHPRYDLLILSRDLPIDLPIREMSSIPLTVLFKRLNIKVGDFSDDFERWINYRYDELDNLQQEHLLTGDSFDNQKKLINALSNRNDFNFIEELVANQSFSIVIAPMPDTILTNSTSSPSCGIVLEQGSEPVSTGGVFTTDHKGVFGVTAALHGVIPDPNKLIDLFNEQGAACVIGKRVYINNIEGIIRKADLITDSCFIEIDRNSVPKLDNQAGPLKDKGPYRSESVRFEGQVSKLQKTVVTEVDIGIPFISRGEQAKIYTHAVTNPGDSGAALINDDNYILGFSYSRTGLGAPIEFAEWMWAHSIYNALNLQ